jgi:DDE_Tnp_1-associated
MWVSNPMIPPESRACPFIIPDRSCPGAIADLPVGDRELLAAGHLSLLDHLARVPDPRKRRGVRHWLSSVLAAAIAAVMAGPQSFTAIGAWIADVPPSMLASLGIRRDPRHS